MFLEVPIAAAAKLLLLLLLLLLLCDCREVRGLGHTH
jgi:hypothetical protein